MSVDPYARPLEYLREGRLIRRAWTGEKDGRWDRMTVGLVEVIEEVRRG